MWQKHMPENVQIPLWTIVTKSSATTTPPTTPSDSSMDDCNGVAGGKFLVVFRVQIPLWTIVTGIFFALFEDVVEQFRFLYGRL